MTAVKFVYDAGPLCRESLFTMSIGDDSLIGGRSRQAAGVLSGGCGSAHGSGYIAKEAHCQ
jgi:hypothetical protein